MALDKNQIAQRIAKELKHNYYVNLGIGIPTLVANYIPEGIDVEFQSENGILGMGPFPLEGNEDADLINAGKQTITTLPGASFFDSAFSSYVLDELYPCPSFLRLLQLILPHLRYYQLPDQIMKFRHVGPDDFPNLN